MSPPAKTISEVFDEFLSDQKARLKPRTFENYDAIIDLFRSYLEGYWPGHDQEEYEQITKKGGTVRRRMVFLFNDN